LPKWTHCIWRDQTFVIYNDKKTALQIACTAVSFAAIRV
jgi:hypothetical protein